jgi:hypothetical protein
MASRSGRRAVLGAFTVYTRRARGEMPEENNESLIGRTTVDTARRFPKDAKR